MQTIALMIANRKGEKIYPFNGYIIGLSLLSLATLIIGLGFL